jgi:hypothetical protein
MLNVFVAFIVWKPLERGFPFFERPTVTLYELTLYIYATRRKVCYNVDTAYIMQTTSAGIFVLENNILIDFYTDKTLFTVT